MTKILFFRKTFLRADSFKRPLIFKSYANYKSIMIQKRFSDLLLNNWCLDVFNFFKTIFHPEIQMILLKQLQV